ncbi:MAG TPA: ADP-ribosylglycohydrolase family protein [Bacteroidales bacterium]|nr:ADP-ribosylglycohydrolase family protein [Bacteroidales bacterium]
MLGAIAGDIIGSRFEVIPTKSLDFQLFTELSTFTDDTVLTVAIAEAILYNQPYEDKLREYGRRYPDAGYGGSFIRWLSGLIPGPYNSYGNGSAMRVSPVGFAFSSEEDVLEEARKTAEVSHNHPEGIKGAQAIALSVFLARQGFNKKHIRQTIEERFGYDLSRKLMEIRPQYHFEVSCQRSVPESIIAFLEADDFVSAIRNAISLGGDSDTMANMAGAIAHAYYKDVPRAVCEAVYARLPEAFKKIIIVFEEHYL